MSVSEELKKREQVSVINQNQVPEVSGVIWYFWNLAPCGVRNAPRHTTMKRIEPKKRKPKQIWDYLRRQPTGENFFVADVILSTPDDPCWSDGFTVFGDSKWSAARQPQEGGYP